MPTQPSIQVAAGFKVGDMLAGKYRIEHVLGVGGMGVVVAAYHIHLEERVAIKFLLPEALGKPDVVARFAREARAAVKIKNEHVARVIDVGTLDNGAPYMVMEHLKGADLSVVLEERGKLSVADAAEYILQACEAMAEAHSLGIIHRDLKPANLFLMRQTDGMNSVKVLDFGISKMTGLVATHSGMAMTGTLAVMGSPLYMSPEQMSSTRDVDERTDIWAIGAILYELITGRPPFDAESIPQLCGMILQGRPPPMVTLRADVPPGIEAVMQRCLEKDREHRYSNVGELAVDLLPFAPKRASISVERIGRIFESTGRGAIAVPPSRAPAPMPAPALDEDVPIAPRLRTRAEDWRRIRAGQRRSQALIIGGVLAVVLLIGLGAWMLRPAPVPAPEDASDEWMLRPATPPPPAAPAPVAKRPARAAEPPVLLPAPAPTPPPPTPAPAIAPIASQVAAPATSTNTPKKLAANPANAESARRKSIPTPAATVASPSRTDSPPSTRAPEPKAASVFDDRK